MVIAKPIPVTVLWDLETCFSNETSAEDAATLVSGMATAYGNIRTFKAFYRPDSGGRAAAYTSFLQGLQRKAVDTIDCSFLEGDAVEKAMTIEMLTDVIDGGFHAPPTIILISQSASLEYAGSKLRNKNYKVFVFKSWDDLREHKSAVVTPPATPLEPNAGDKAVIARTDPMSVMGHADSVTQQRFRVLIEALWESIEDGEPRVSRANIGNILIHRDADVYQNAQFFGNSAFKNYIATAEQRGVIRCGGGGAGAWVELRTSGAGSSVAPGAN